MLKFDNVSFSYKDGAGSKVLDKTNFEIENASIVSMIGPSGCGKTTIAKLIAGYLMPTTGTVSIMGEQVLKPNHSRFIISQEDDLLDWMTVKKNIQFAAKTDVTKYLRLVHLEGDSDKYPYQLSGGMKKRVAIARALAADAKYLIIDEAFGSLDYQIKEHLYYELLHIWEETGKTILLITHDLDEAIFLSDKIIVLTKTPSHVKTTIQIPFPRPRDEQLFYTQEFIKLKRRIQELIDT